MKVTIPTAEAPAAGGGGVADGDQCAVVSPPKKGGECAGLDGALIVVQPGAYHPKKDALTFARAAAAERHQYVPSPRRADETLWSEVYTLGGRGRALKAGVRVALPVRSLQHPDVQGAHLRVRGAGDDQWQYADYDKSERDGRPFIEFTLAKAASFAVTISPKTETFVVTDQGLLYNAKISHYVSVRFPKKSIDANQMEFSIQIRRLDNLKMSLMKDEQVDEVGDFVAASDFYDITGPQVFFRRALTVKIGVPAEGFEEENADCIALFRRALPSSDGGEPGVNTAWSMVEEQLKFTKTTVTFNTNQLGRFVVARAKPKRLPRLQSVMGIVERRNSRVRCAVVASLKRERKAWTLWMDAVRVDEVASAVARRESRGAVCLDGGDTRALRGRIESDETSASDSRFAGRYHRGARKRVPAKKEVTYLAFADSTIAVRFEVCGDLQIVGEVEADTAETEATAAGAPVGSRGPRLHEVLFCDALSENARAFAVQPRKSIYMAAPVGVINLYAATDSEGSVGGGGELLRSITVALDVKSVDDYYREDPPPIQPAPAEPMDTDAAPRPSTPDETPAAATRLPPIRFKPISAHLSRLAASNRVAARPIKEPRVLSGKSLQALANYVTEGLSLAVHLGISESVITGIGFDALSNGLGLPEVTYRMLLRWKRMGRATAPERVGQLSEALKAIGRVDIAALVWECHARSQELTAETLRVGHALPADTADDDMENGENAE